MIMESKEDVKSQEHSESASTGLLGRVVGDGSVVQIGKDMMWPRIANEGHSEWIMRYGAEKDVLEKRFYVASVIASYKALICMPQKRRNAICKAIQNAT